MRSILVAINGFPGAETTVTAAAGLASALMAPLCILHVRPAPADGHAPIGAADSEAPNSRCDLLAELVHWSARLANLTAAGDDPEVDPGPYADLRRAADQAQRAGVANVLTCLTAGDPVEVILAQARRTNADLLVIGRGRSPIAVGQTAAALIGRCPCAVLIAGGVRPLH